MSDLVSVVTTLYNYACYIGDLIRSAQDQDYPNWELIIVDDASTDNPLEIIKPFLAEDKRICYIALLQNRGYSVAKNEGILKTKGEYIVMIDADDQLTPGSISTRYRLLRSWSSRLWCHGNVFILDEKGNMSSCDAMRRMEYRNSNLCQGYHHRMIHAQSVMVKKDFHRKLGLYDENLRFSSDNEMFRRAIRFGYIPLFTAEYVSKYRCHPNRMSRSVEKKQQVARIKKYITEVVERRFREGINSSNTRLLV